MVTDKFKELETVVRSKSSFMALLFIKYKINIPEIRIHLIKYQMY